MSTVLQFWHTTRYTYVATSDTAHSNRPLVTADTRHYTDAATTTRAVQTSPRTRNRLLVHHPRSLHVPLLVNTRPSKQLLRSVSSKQHYYMKTMYNETPLPVLKQQTNH